MKSLTIKIQPSNVPGKSVIWAKINDSEEQASHVATDKVADYVKKLIEQTGEV